MGCVDVQFFYSLFLKVNVMCGCEPPKYVLLAVMKLVEIGRYQAFSNLLN